MSIKVKVETVIEGSAREGVAWGVGANGEAVLVVVAGSQRVLVALDYVDAIDACIGGIYVGQGIRMAMNEAQGHPAPQSRLVDVSGVPLGKGG